MTHLTSSMAGLVGLAMFASGGPADAQIFVRNSTDVPNQTPGAARFCENVDFGDVDLDGDFDAAFSHGGDQGNIQSRIWINGGGLQPGTVGVFVDETTTRLPQVPRDGRDIEFVDFDNDGDLDLHNSNTSSQSNQTNTWWTNQGGQQAGALGFYVDETASRWVGLGGPGSSIPPSQLIGGGFLDFSGDSDFGDLDNDGDMDLVHSSVGGAFSGQVPTRLFLNDGDGHFEEFNPSDFQLSSVNISEGSPGLWCEGTQQANTTDTTGANCDVAAAALDIDVGDVDADFDLDILHGDFNNVPRFFYNRLQENGPTPADLAFRDVTNYVYGLAGVWAVNVGHSAQEMGDFDADSDLDLVGMNWQATSLNFDEVVAPNVGGRFGPQTILVGPAAFDNEGDFGDFDNDGDLDLFAANISPSDRLFENTDGLGSFAFVPTASSGLDAIGLGFPFSNTSLDAEWGDVDGDGDYDVFSAQDDAKPVIYWQNTVDTPDTTAPRVGPLEDLSDGTAGIHGDPDRAVRAHVYDNAAYYVTWYNPTSLLLSIEGVQVDRLPAQSVGGQVFRAEIGSNVVGDVTYRFRSGDQYGNTGFSSSEGYTASEGARFAEIVYGTPFVGQLGLEYELHSRALLTAGKRWYTVMDTKGAARIHFLSMSLGSVAPTADPLVGTLNLDTAQVFLQQIGITNAAGFKSRKYDIPDDVSGVFSIFLQGFVLEPAGSPTTWSSTKGVEVPFYE